MTRETMLKLKKTLQGEVYKDFVDWLMLQVKDLRSIDNVREYSKAQDQAIELKAQKKAFSKLCGILDEIVFIKEQLDKEDEQEEKGIDDNGLETGSNE